MSDKGTDKTRLAHQMQRDLNSYQAKQGIGSQSDSTVESGVNEWVKDKFPEAGSLRIGRDADPILSNRKPISEEEGGTRDDRGRLAPAEKYEGRGGPEDKVKYESERRPGDDDTLNLQDMKRLGLIR